MEASSRQVAIVFYAKISFCSWVLVVGREGIPTPILLQIKYLDMKNTHPCPPSKYWFMPWGFPIIMWSVWSNRFVTKRSAKHVITQNTKFVLSLFSLTHHKDTCVWNSSASPEDLEAVISDLGRKDSLKKPLRWFWWISISNFHIWRTTVIKYTLKTFQNSEAGTRVRCPDTRRVLRRTAFFNSIPQAPACLPPVEALQNRIRKRPPWESYKW